MLFSPFGFRLLHNLQAEIAVKEWIPSSGSENRSEIKLYKRTRMNGDKGSQSSEYFPSVKMFDEDLIPSSMFGTSMNESFLSSSSTFFSSTSPEIPPIPEAPDYVPYVYRIETYLVPLVFAIIFVIGLIGNGSLIFIFVKHKSLRNVPNTFIIVLSRRRHDGHRRNHSIHLPHLHPWFLAFRNVHLQSVRVHARSIHRSNFTQSHGPCPSTDTWQSQWLWNSSKWTVVPKRWLTVSQPLSGPPR